MRLSQFNLSNLEEILMEWESFARTIIPAKDSDQLALRDHATEILEAIALDIETAQTELAQAEKSKVAGIAVSRILPQKFIVRSVFGRVSTKSKWFPNTAHFAHRSLDCGLPLHRSWMHRFLSINPVQ